MSKSSTPPFLIITKKAPNGDMNSYHIHMKSHTDPKKMGVYVVDTENPLNKYNLEVLPEFNNEKKEYVLSGDTTVNLGGRRRSKKAPTTRRRRSSKARKARATRRK